MGQLFVDTWAWYALADRYDRDHVAAQQAIDSLLSDGESLVTTNFVVAESITLIRYHLHHTAAIQYRRLLDNLIGTTLLRLVRVTEEQEDAAWAIFSRYHDQKLSYTDCLSFAVMQELKIERAVTKDHHFAVLGFILVP